MSALAYAHFERVERDFDEIATVSALWKKYLKSFPNYAETEDHISEDL
ncbi:MAG: hypothetical protein ACLUSP_06390 [Christensenellales bacterium]